MEEFNIHNWQARHLRKKINEDTEFEKQWKDDYDDKNFGNQRDELMTRAEVGIDELVMTLKQEAYDLGGNTNGPGIWYDIKELFREKL